MARVSGNPVRLEEYRATTIPTLESAAGALQDYRAALHRFEAEPNDLRTTLPDHSPALDSSLADLRDLDHLPAAFAGALRQVDATFSARGVLSTDADARFRTALAARRWLPHGEGVLRRADETLSAHEALMTAGRTGYYAAHLGNRAVHLHNLRGRRPSARDYHGNPTLSATHTRAERRALATTNRLTWRRQTTSVQLQITTTRTALRNQVPVSTLGRNLSTSRLGAAARVGGRALGIAGAAFTLADTAHAAQQRNWGDVASNVSSLVGSALLLNPITAPAGAALVLGALIYEMVES